MVPASHTKASIFIFGRFRLDVAQRLLTTESKPVALTPKVFDLLVLLAQHPGELLEKDFILSTLWPDTFVEEANLSVNISTLRRALESAGGGAHYIETVPKRGYRFTAGVQDLSRTNGEELSPSADSVLPPVAAKNTLRFRLALVGFLLALLAIYFGLNHLNHPLENLVEVRSIAVLPFRPLLANATQSEDAYLGPGMSDAIIRKLSVVRKVTVRATSAVQKFQALHVDPLVAGRELAVDVVLDGTIQHVGNSIRVSVQLLRVRDGAPLWADHFDDYFTNIFQLQDSISEKIVTALKMKLSESEHQRMAKQLTTSMEAYQLYLKGHYCEYRRTPDTLDDLCIDDYEAAVAKDPDYALAYTGIASAYMDIAGIEGRPDATAKARAAAVRAIALDDSLAEAHLALGNVLFRGDWDWLGAEREFDRALELDPRSSLAHWYMSLLALAMGHNDRGLAEMQQAQLLDPASENIHDDLGWVYYLNRRFDQALDESKKVIALEPQSISAHHQLGKTYLQLRRFAQAEQEFRFTVTLNEIHRGYADLGQLLALTGRTAQARSVLADLQRIDKSRRTYESEYMRAILLASLGDTDAAFQSLEGAISHKLSRAIWMRADPDLDPIHSDPRFNALLRRIHLLN